MNKWLLTLTLAFPILVGSAFPRPVSAQREIDFFTAPVNWPTIKKGDKFLNERPNRRVMAVQYLLRNRGFYRAKIDGVYGSQTIAAVKAFQRLNKLFVDGIAGPKTLQKLVVKVKRGSRGDAVRAAQILAQGTFNHVADQPNLGLKIDGVFGAATEEAVKVAQYNIRGMEGMYAESDGIMGLRTWGLLLGGRVKGDR